MHSIDRIKPMKFKLDIKLCSKNQAILLEISSKSLKFMMMILNDKCIELIRVNRIKLMEFKLDIKLFSINQAIPFKSQL